MSTAIERLAGRLREGVALPGDMTILVAGCRLRIQTSTLELSATLERYFAPFLARGPERADVRVVAIERPAPDLGLTFADWTREPGKSGRKEEYADIEGGRVVRKVRTGMEFVLAPGEKLAVGPCLANDNQVINFVIAQYITLLLHRRWLLCHAAGVVVSGGHGLAISAVSGGGKSTLALQLMSRGARFTSNDRLLVASDGGGEGLEMAGVPKLPRINPGTALGNPDLSEVLTPERRQELRALDEDDLWELEEKYDVDIAKTFGPDRFRLTAPLSAFLVLTWQRDSPEPFALHRVDLAEHDRLLDVIAKSAGPFYEPPDGRPPLGQSPVELAPYRKRLAGLTAWEATGRVDFDAATERILGELGAG